MPYFQKTVFALKNSWLRAWFYKVFFLTITQNFWGKVEPIEDKDLCAVSAFRDVNQVTQENLIDLESYSTSESNYKLSSQGGLRIALYYHVLIYTF